MHAIRLSPDDITRKEVTLKMPKDDHNQLNDAHELSEFFTDEDAIADIEKDSVQEYFGNDGTWIQGKDYPDYFVDELYKQDHFDLDNQPR